MLSERGVEAAGGWSRWREGACEQPREQRPRFFVVDLTGRWYGRPQGVVASPSRRTTDARRSRPVARSPSCTSSAVGPRPRAARPGEIAIFGRRPVAVRHGKRLLIQVFGADLVRRTHRPWRIAPAEVPRDPLLAALSAEQRLVRLRLLAQPLEPVPRRGPSSTSTPSSGASPSTVRAASCVPTAPVHLLSEGLRVPGRPPREPASGPVQSGLPRSAVGEDLRVRLEPRPLVAECARRSATTATTVFLRPSTATAAPLRATVDACRRRYRFTGSTTA